MTVYQIFSEQVEGIGWIAHATPRSHPVGAALRCANLHVSGNPAHGVMVPACAAQRRTYGSGKRLLIAARPTRDTSIFIFHVAKSYDSTYTTTMIVDTIIFSLRQSGTVYYLSYLRKS